MKYNKLILAIMVAATMFACKPTKTETYQITGKLFDWGMGNDFVKEMINEIRALEGEENGNILAACKLTDCNFTLNLPKYPDEKAISIEKAFKKIDYFFDEEEIFTLNKSNPNTKGFFAYFMCYFNSRAAALPIAYNLDALMGESETIIVMLYFYSDNDCNITGTISYQSVIEANIDLKLKHGWNKIYISYVNDDDEAGTITTELSENHEFIWFPN